MSWQNFRYWLRGRFPRYRPTGPMSTEPPLELQWVGEIPLISDEGVTMIPVSAEALAKLREMERDNRTFRIVDEQPECTCELVEVSTPGKYQFVRGLSGGCVIHPPSESERRHMQAAAERDARIAAAMKAAREAP